MNMHKAFSQSPQAYRLKNSPVFDGLSLDDDQIQKYINNPWGVYMTDEQEGQLKGNIQDQIGDFLEEAAIDIDELSRDEIDEACKIVSLGIRDVEAANAMAVNTGPRMLVADLADSAYAREKVSAALREATANHEVGSDDWYATLADGYIDYLMKGGDLQYNMPRKRCELLRWRPTAKSSQLPLRKPLVRMPSGSMIVTCEGSASSGLAH